jgi:prepilin-type N-terminal cleavage/methylation domain-containing protein
MKQKLQLPVRVAGSKVYLFMKKSAPGFTLVELLVVIAILAILSLIGITLYGDVQKKSRDGKRIGDINAIADALEAHYGDSTCTPYCAVATTWFTGGVVPSNPSPGGAAYVLTGTLPGLSYVYCASLEKGNGNYSDSGGVTPASGTTAVWFCRKSQQ